MPTLSTLTPDKTTVAVPIGGDVLTVAYRPSRITPQLQERLRTMLDGGSMQTALCEPLADLLVAWDLTEDDGAPVPITAERLAGLPLVILAHVLTALLDGASTTLLPAHPGHAAPNGASTGRRR